MEELKIGNLTFRADRMELLNVKILLIQTGKGALGCGYFNLAAAEKFGHALAIVSGVSSYDEMLTAEVRSVSSAAADLGVSAGMTGLEALQKMY